MPPAISFAKATSLFKLKVCQIPFLAVNVMVGNGLWLKHMMALS